VGPSIKNGVIALVKLDKSVASADDVACIPPANYNFDVSFPDGDLDAFTAGWGRTLTSSGTIIKSREVNVPMVADDTCENKYQSILGLGFEYGFSVFVPKSKMLPCRDK